MEDGIHLELLGEREDNLKFHYSTAPNTIGGIFQNHNVHGLPYSFNHIFRIQTRYAQI